MDIGRGNPSLILAFDAIPLCPSAIDPCLTLVPGRLIVRPSGACVEASIVVQHQVAVAAFRPDARACTDDFHADLPGQVRDYRVSCYGTTSFQVHKATVDSRYCLFVQRYTTEPSVESK
jgi:hypothetical protein